MRKEENKKEKGAFFPEIAGPTYQSLATQLTTQYKVQYAYQIRRFKDTGEIGNRQEKVGYLFFCIYNKVLKHRLYILHILLCTKISENK